MVCKINTYDCIVLKVRYTIIKKNLVSHHLVGHLKLYQSNKLIKFLKRNVEVFFR